MPSNAASYPMRANRAASSNSACCTVLEPMPANRDRCARNSPNVNAANDHPLLFVNICPA